MANRWSLAFAPTKSFLACCREDGKQEVIEFSLVGEEGILQPEEVIVNERPVLELFQPGDSLYCEMGGRNGPFLVRLADERKDVEIYQIPIAKLKSLNGDDKLASDENEEDEEAEGNKAEQSRRARALEILQLSVEAPNEFYKMMEISPVVWRILTDIHIYMSLQKDDRIKAQHRARMRQSDFAWLPDKLGDKQIIQTRELLARNSDIKYYLELESAMLKSIKKELPGLPIWQEFLGPMSGIGPSIAGRIIGAIKDIRRFPKRDGFRAYAAYSVVDGKAPRMRRKQEDGTKPAGSSYSPDLKQALFLVGDQAVKNPKNPYNIWYVRGRVKYYGQHLLRLIEDGKFFGDELNNLAKQLQSASSPDVLGDELNAVLEKAKIVFQQNPKLRKAMNLIHCNRKAIRYAVSRFVNDLWCAWWRTVEEQVGTDSLPESVRAVLYPRMPS